jgi:hypothetical protein
MTACVTRDICIKIEHNLTHSHTHVRTHTDSSTHPVAPPPHRTLGLDSNPLLCTLAGSAALTNCTCNAGSSGPNFNCTACVTGKYKVLTGSAPCTDCGAGKYGFATGQTAEASCTACGTGKYGVATGQTTEASCTACGAGKYSAGGADMCITFVAAETSECCTAVDELGDEVKRLKHEGELEFDGQALHVDFAEAPTAVEYVPAGQAVHDASADCPVPVPYLPAPQAMQSPLPAPDLYLPASHSVQLPPAAPDDPALQIQDDEAELPGGQLEFDGQALHVEFAEAPTAVEYDPAGQAVHDACPVPTPYFPAAQT